MHKVLRYGMPLFLILLGAAGAATMRHRAQLLGTYNPLGPDFWRIEREESGAPDTGEEDGDDNARAPGGGLRLSPGKIFRFTEEDGEEHRYATLGFSLQADEVNAVAEITLRQTTRSSLVVTLHAGEPFTGSIVLRKANGESRQLVSVKRAGLLAHPLDSFPVTVRLQDSGISVHVAGQQLLACKEPGDFHGKMSIRSNSGDMHLLSATATGTGTSQRGTKKSFADSVHLAATPEPWWRSSLFGLGVTACAWLLAGAWLGALCLGRASLARLAPAATLMLATTCVPVAAALLRTPPHVDVLIVLAGAVGLLLALARLRPVLAPAAPVAPAASTGSVALRRGVAALFVLLVVGGAAVLLGRQMSAQLRLVTDHESLARSQPVPRAWSRRDPITLDAANSLVSPALYHNFTLRARLELPADAALGVRLRAPEAAVARGHLLVLSNDARLPSGFWFEDLERFDPPESPAAAPGSAGSVQLEVTARGRELSAQLDGKPLAQIESTEFTSGAIVLVALGGQPRVTELDVEGLPSDEEPATTLPRTMLAGAAVPLAVVLFALLAAAVVRRPLAVTLCACSFALVPIVLGSLFQHEPNHVNVYELRQMGALAIGALASFALLHGALGGRPVASALWLLPAAALLVVGGLGIAIDRTVVIDAAQLNRMSYLDWEGERIDDSLLWLRHPLLRRWNDYQALHAFREHNYPLVKPPGTVRVLALGGSSTWGYRIPAASRGDYPAQLEERLNHREPGDSAPRVQVINGAFVGATGARLYRCLRDALLPFSPDVVTLSLTFNDSSSCSQGDEDGYYDLITRPDYRRPWWRSWWEDWQLGRECDREREAMKSMVEEARHDPRSTTELWHAHDLHSSPPDRFAGMLRRFAELAQARGFQLVLIKEPMIGPGRVIWKEEFYAAIDQVAAEYHLTVVDPTPDLLAAGGESLFMDVVHPTRDGNAVIAEDLEKALRPLLPR